MPTPRSLVVRSLLWGAIALSVLYGCSDPEAAARQKYNEGMTLQQQGKLTAAISAYKEVVAKYPGTQTAVDANKLLTLLNSVGTLSNAQGLITEQRRKSIEAALDLFRLDNGRYPTTSEGLKALMTKPRSASHWGGPYLKPPAALWLYAWKYESSGTFGPGRYTLSPP